MGDRSAGVPFKDFLAVDHHDSYPLVYRLYKFTNLTNLHFSWVVKTPKRISYTLMQCLDCEYEQKLFYIGHYMQLSGESPSFIQFHKLKSPESISSGNQDSIAHYDNGNKITLKKTPEFIRMMTVQGVPKRLVLYINHHGYHRSSVFPCRLINWNEISACRMSTLSTFQCTQALQTLQNQRWTDHEFDQRLSYPLKSIKICWVHIHKEENTRKVTYGSQLVYKIITLVESLKNFRCTYPLHIELWDKLYTDIGWVSSSSKDVVHCRCFRNNHRNWISCPQILLLLFFVCCKLSMRFIHSLWSSVV